MSTTPPDAPTGAEQQHEPGDHGHDGPRVTRDEAKDLGRIRRSRGDRKVAGVAAGIARHLDVDPLLVRVGFVLLTIFGGAGILLYGACWLLVPEEDTEDAVVNVEHGTRTVILAIVGVISVIAVVGDSLGEWHFPWPLAIAGLVLAVVLARNGKLPAPPSSGPFAPPGGTPTGVHQPSQPEPGAEQAGAPSYVGYRPPPPPPPSRPADPRKRGPILFLFTAGLAALLVGVLATVDAAGEDIPLAAYPATVLATCGLMLLVGAFYGRAGGLILVGLLAAAATAATTVADDLSIGRLSRSPDTAAELESSYKLGVGELRIDLRDLDLSTLAGDRTLDLDLDIGKIEVIVPETGLDVAARADISEEGHMVVFDEESDSSGDLRSDHDGGPDADTPQLTINATTDLGEIRILTEAAR